MLHPIGSLPPHVYWRRRFMVGGTLAAIALLVLTIYAFSSNGTKAEDAGKTAPHSSAPGSSTVPSSASSSPSSGVDASSVSSSTPATPSGSGTATPAACIGAQLTISATSSAPTYKVGDQPVLMLLVKNNGPGNCTQDLADSQVELRVFNGAARVWGSHDCLVQPGTDVKTLVAGTTVGVNVTWSGLSSEAGCAGTRQRVGAGTYTLFPYLAGAQGTTSQFSITAS
jgi:hypothetical protein